MRNIYNKKKSNFLNIKKILKYFVLSFFLFYLFFFIYNETKDRQKYYNLIQIFSDKFDYNLKTYKINTLKRVDKVQIFGMMDQYLEKSIFLIPLDIISKNLHEVKWVKKINLKTNLKNNVTIDIEEYIPIGLYVFNDNLFYFSDEGKIIDSYKKKISEQFIIFYGNQSLKKADSFLNRINNIEKIDLIKIKEAYFINDRRWNIRLDNDLILYLSEKNIETSIKNYIKLYNKLKKSEIISIKSIDLRNDKKAIISLKIDD